MAKRDIFYDTKELKPYYDDLLNNNLIEYNPLFKNTLKNIKVVALLKGLFLFSVVANSSATINNKE